MKTPRMNIADATPDSGIYRITCEATGESYIGASADIRKRARQHAGRLACHRNSITKLQNAYDEHGASKFRLEVVERCSADELADREGAWIEKLSPAFNTNVRQSKQHYKQYPKGFSHVERRSRAEQMAIQVAGGRDPAHVASNFGVAVVTVKSACRKHRLTTSR